MFGTNQDILSFWNWYTKATKQVIDNTSEYPMGKSDFAVLSRVEDTTEITERFVSITGLSVAEDVAEGSKIPQGKSAKGFVTELSPIKQAVSLDYTREYMKGVMDNTQKLEKQYQVDVRDRLSAVYNKLNTTVFELINKGFTDTLSPDGELLFSANHLLSPESAIEFDNLLPAAAPSVEVLDEVEKRSRGFVDAIGRPMPFNTKRILVKDGGKAHQKWKKILGDNVSLQYKPTKIDAINEGVNQQLGNGRQIIPSVYVESDTAYYFMADFDSQMMVNPIYTGFHQRPTMDGEFDYDKRTQLYSVPFFDYYKTGVVNTPVGMYWSQGA